MTSKPLNHLIFLEFSLVEKIEKPIYDNANKSFVCRRSNLSSIYACSFFCVMFMMINVKRKLAEVHDENTKSPFAPTRCSRNLFVAIYGLLSPANYFSRSFVFSSRREKCKNFFPSSQDVEKQFTTFYYDGATKRVPY